MPKYYNIADAPIQDTADNGWIGIDSNGRLIRSRTRLNTEELEKLDKIDESVNRLDEKDVEFRQYLNATLTARDISISASNESQNFANVASENAIVSDQNAKMTEVYVSQAQKAALDAQSVAVAAGTAARFYDNIAAGRASVLDGEQFGVISGGIDGLSRATVFRRISETSQIPVLPIVTPSEIDSEINARRRLIRSSVAPGLAAAIMDQNNNMTWLAARESDGGPPDWVVEHLESRMESTSGISEIVNDLEEETIARSSIIRIDSAPGLAAAIMDQNNNMTWLAASVNGGGMPGWVAEHVAERVSPYLSLSDASILPSDRALVNGTLVPILPDMTRMAGWGSSTMEYMGTEVAAEMSTLGVTYYNGGDAGVRAEHTLAQLGSHPALITIAGGNIPASGPVNVTSSNVRATSLLKPFTGTLAGVVGTLSSTSASLIFTRAADGVAVPVAAGTPFIPTVGPQYRDAVNILNIGKNDIGSAGADTMIIEKTAEAFEWLSPMVKRVIVMGHAVNRDTADNSPGRAQIMTINSSFSQTYGGLYFDLQGYMISAQIWIDSGVTPTQADLDAQARGNKPPSLSLDDLHFNNAGDTAVAKALRRFIINLGWYKEPTI